MASDSRNRRNPRRIASDSKLLLAHLPNIWSDPAMTLQTPDFDPKTPAEVHDDPVAGACGFLVARPSLWFTPFHIMAMILPKEPAFFMANPPFGRSTAEGNANFG
jgi:hypothetical protein